MDLLNLIFMVFIATVKSNIWENHQTVGVAVNKVRIPDGRNDSNTLIYSILFKDSSKLPTSHLFVASNQPNAFGGGYQVDYCYDDQRRAFLAIERSTNVILTGFWITDHKKYYTLECTFTMCNLTLLELLHKGSTINLEDILRNKRSADRPELLQVLEPTNRTFHVSVLLIVDSATVRAHCKNWPECCENTKPKLDLCNRIKNYYKNLMAAGSQFFASIDNTQMHIKLYLGSLLQLPEVYNRSYFDDLILNGTEKKINVSSALSKAVQLIQNTDFGQSLKGKYGAIVFFVTHQLVVTASDSAFTGRSYIGGVCTRYNVAIIHESFGYGYFFTFVQQIASLLGADSDRNTLKCWRQEEGLMGLHYTDNLSEMFRFSCCSLVHMYKVLRNAKCASSPPADPTDISYHNPNLGELLGHSEYCKLRFGESYTPCVNYSSICQKVECRETYRSVCTFYVANPALNGMSCSADNTKWCMHGHCVQKDTFSFKDEVEKNCDVLQDRVTKTSKQTLPNTITSTSSTTTNKTLATTSYLTQNTNEERLATTTRMINLYSEAQISLNDPNQTLTNLSSITQITNEESTLTTTTMTEPYSETQLSLTDTNQTLKTPSYLTQNRNDERQLTTNRTTNRYSESQTSTLVTHHTKTSTLNSNRSKGMESAETTARTRFPYHNPQTIDAYQTLKTTTVTRQIEGRERTVEAWSAGAFIGLTALIFLIGGTVCMMRIKRQQYGGQ